MGLFLNYSFRNILVRKLTTTLTVLGLGLVIFVFTAVLMLAHGLEETLVETGSPDNIIAVRSAATSETVSIMSRTQAGILKTQDDIAVDAEGRQIAVNELVVLINLNKRRNDDPSNIVLRGTTGEAFTLRPSVRLTAGRMFASGTSEVISGASVSANFKGCGLGESVRFAGREWQVVGLFDADGAGFDSEMWADVEQVQQAFRRPIFSSVTARMRDASKISEFKTRLEADPRMTVTIKNEQEFYAEQSRATATFIRVIGLVVSIVFAVGAMIGAMITMYAAVSNRTSEIGTLRALGFSRGRVLTVFLSEAIWLSLIGAAIGLGAASFMSLVRVSTTNWDTFSELAFSFRLSPGIVLGTIIFAVTMGILGGFLPAVRAARARIIESLRAE